ncbi:MAG: hypothetical protein IJP77_05520 [Bacteroidales bacterium]|nr:hypothetical protein [Bacteroidales bacterium]
MKTIQFTLLFLCALGSFIPAGAQNGDKGPERHALLALKPSDKDSQTAGILDQTAWEFIYYKPQQIKDFAGQLCKRIKWDLQVTDEMAEGKRAKDAALEQALIDECRVFVDFMLRLGQIAERHTNVRMNRNAQGEWAYSLTPAPEFETGLWPQHVPKALKNKDVKTYAACMVKGVYYFCERPLGGGFVPVVLDDDELYVPGVSLALIRNIGLMYENGILDLLKEMTSDKYYQDMYDRSYQTCLLYMDAVNKALSNNDKIEIQYEPMPKAGAMNASMKAKVLPLEKAITDKVVDCVVTSDGWKVETDAAGTPIRRVIYGYSIVQTKRGKQATRVSWAEDYQGGGQYGALHAYGVGGGKFYVK